MRKLLLFIFALLLFFPACRKPKPRLPGALPPPKPQTLRRDFKQPPFKPGEKLTYELRFTRLPLSINAGTITFENLGVTSQPVWDHPNFKAQSEDRLLHLRATITAKGLLLRIFGLSVNDRFETLVNAQDFKMRAVLREIEEGKKHNLQTGYFNYPQTPAREKILPLEPNMQDLLSTFYLIRLQELKENTIFTFPLVYEGDRKEFDLVVHQREELKIDLGKFKTILTEPKLFGPNRLSTREGEFLLWLTDDAAHIPVRLSVKSSGATITATLIKKE
jgi:hypothetical protein